MAVTKSLFCLHVDVWQKKINIYKDWMRSGGLFVNVTQHQQDVHALGFQMVVQTSREQQKHTETHNLHAESCWILKLHTEFYHYMSSPGTPRRVLTLHVKSWHYKWSPDTTREVLTLHTESWEASDCSCKLALNAALKICLWTGECSEKLVHRQTPVLVWVCVCVWPVTVSQKWID